jgi:hypothetical protein
MTNPVVEAVVIAPAKVGARAARRLMALAMYR